MATTKTEAPLKSVISWRILTTNDTASLVRVADKIHPELPESDAVFEERVKLFPDGCLGLSEERSNELHGYIISHPIRFRQPPALDQLLGAIPQDADQYYIHDVAVLPELRGSGFAQDGVNRVLAVAEQFKTVGLVSVYGTAAFWGRFGFKEPQAVGQVLEEKLASFGGEARYLERDTAEVEDG
ncbi:hypothetical protein IQ07DRAFT_593483 [Pyrenochaeta sp. DS3sAY3a]|nr:hypothetical protein IQ07DRAFT_593483 [Pyrenochaeta sp. DS3sAY3a]